MNKELADFIGAMVLLAIIAGLVWSVTASIAQVQEDALIKTNYCEERGWEGYGRLDSERDTRCYKLIPHESGTGTYREWSGTIMDDIERIQNE